MEAVSLLPLTNKRDYPGLFVSRGQGRELRMICTGHSNSVYPHISGVPILCAGLCRVATWVFMSVDTGDLIGWR